MQRRYTCDVCSYFLEMYSQHTTIFFDIKSNKRDVICRFQSYVLHFWLLSSCYFPAQGSRVFVMWSYKSQYVFKPLPAIVGVVRIVNVVCTTVITRLYPDTTMRVTSHYHKGVSFLLICSSTVCSEADLVQQQINDQNTVVVICA